MSNGCHGAARAALDPKSVFMVVVSFIAVLAIAVAGFVVTGLGAAAPAQATTPGTPGVPQPGTPVYTEDFSNQNATSSAISILNYTGGAAAANMTYTADPQYTPAGNQCNGWILNSFTPQPPLSADAGCANNAPSAWQNLRQMAVQLGLAQGQTPAKAASNQVLSAFTNALGGAIPAGTEFRTASATAIPAIPGHYYAVSAYFAAMNCPASSGTAQPNETFSLIVNGSPVVLSTGLNPCTNPTDWSAQVTRLQSAAYMVPPGATANLGLSLYNAQTSGAGNDVAFDLPQIVDVTPQLDKSFSPSLIAPGQTSTVTLTVTNTSDLKAKPDWSITDTLPPGLVIAPNAAIGGTCAQVTGASFVRTGSAGSNVFTATGGDLAVGQSSCTITFNVTAAAEGSYVNGPANITTNLNPPANATLTVRAPRIALAKALSAPREAATDQFTMQIRTGGATGPVVNSTANSTTTGTGSTVSAGTGTTGTYVAAAGTAYTLTEAAAGTTNPSNYTGTITCTDSYRLQTGLPNGAVFNPGSPPSITPVAGANISCTITNSAQPIINVAKQAGSVTGPDANGDYIATYTVTVTNSGSVAGTYGTLTDTPAFAANLAATAASWTTSGTGAPAGGTSATAGPYTLAPAGSTIGAGAIHTFDLAVTFRYTNTAQATPCSGPGTGLYNSAALPAGQEQGPTADNSACDAPPTGHLFVQKAGPGPTPGSTVPLAGSTFEVHADANGQMGTAIGTTSPVSGSIGLSEVRNLSAGTYWLLEVKAPNGYSLLATPVKFALAADGGITLDPATAGTSVTAKGSTITVVDVAAVKLPFAGGPGADGLWGLPLLGILLLIASLVLIAYGRAYRTPRSGIAERGSAHFLGGNKKKGKR